MSESDSPETPQDVQRSSLYTAGIEANPLPLSAVHPWERSIWCFVKERSSAERPWPFVRCRDDCTYLAYAS